MVLKEAAKIYLALTKFSEVDDLSFSDALKIIKIKKELQDYYDLISQKELNILKKYAQFNQDGNIVLRDNKYPIAKSEDDAKKMRIELDELYSEKVNHEFQHIIVKTPLGKGALTLEDIEALSSVIEFN